KVAGVADQHGDDPVASVALPGPRDTGQNRLHALTLVAVDDAGPAVATGVAALTRGGVAEIPQNAAAQTHGAVGVLDHPPELAMLELLSARDLRRIARVARAVASIAPRAVDQVLARRDVGRIPQQGCGRRPSVAAGA